MVRADVLFIRVSSWMLYSIPSVYPPSYSATTPYLARGGSHSASQRLERDASSSSADHTNNVELSCELSLKRLAVVRNMIAAFCSCSTSARLLRNTVLFFVRLTVAG